MKWNDEVTFGTDEYDDRYILTNYGLSKYIKLGDGVYTTELVITKEAFVKMLEE